MKKIKEIVWDKVVYIIAIVAIACGSWFSTFISRVSALENSNEQTQQDVREIKTDTKIIRCMLKDDFACKSLGTAQR